MSNREVMNAPLISPTPNIHKARFEAKRLLLSVERDGVNADAGYSYVKTDSMMQATRPVFDKVGLDVSQTDWVISDDRSKTVSTFEVFHPTSGELAIHKAEFPVFYDGEQDDDKAIAASLTTCWSYWLRGYLQLPRKDGVEMDSRPAAPRPSSAPSSPFHRDVFNGSRGQRQPVQVETFAGHPVQWETVRMIAASHRRSLTDRWKARLEQELYGKPMVEVPQYIEETIAEMKQRSGARAKQQWRNERGRQERWRANG